MSTLHDARADRRRVQHALERHPDRALLGRGPLEVLEHRPDVVEVVSLTRYLVRATLTTLWCNHCEASSHWHTNTHTHACTNYCQSIFGS